MPWRPSRWPVHAQLGGSGDAAQGPGQITAGMLIRDLVIVSSNKRRSKPLSRALREAAKTQAAGLPVRTGIRESSRFRRRCELRYVHQPRPGRRRQRRQCLVAQDRRERVAAGRQHRADQAVDALLDVAGLGPVSAPNSQMTTAAKGCPCTSSVTVSRPSAASVVAKGAMSTESPRSDASGCRGVTFSRGGGAR